MLFFQDLMPNLRGGRWSPSNLRKHLFGDETATIDTLCRQMMESDGEYSSLLLAERIFTAYEKLDDDGRRWFFTLLQDDYDIDLGEVKTALDAYEKEPEADNLQRIGKAAEPRRQELLRRLNLAQGATRRLVKIREHLLSAMREQPELKRVDNDFLHLFSTWFNRGFLMMEPIDWTTSAHILEKIIAYEAVHEIEDWDELRSRLEPDDRLCFGFFHPRMGDEPLVFVEVALTDDMPRGIGEILERDASAVAPDKASCAIFYSISNCHKGLAGVSFGNFLIKQVATSLKMQFPQLKTFATISPVPRLREWLEQQPDEDRGIRELLDTFDTDADEDQRARLENTVARYFLTQKNADGEPLDPVARFHLKNGAILERINILGNPSPKGMQRALGTMVNYVYDLNRVEDNHEAYVTHHEVICSAAVRKALAR